jgi:hypothetical protein
MERRGGGDPPNEPAGGDGGKVIPMNRGNILFPQADRPEAAPQPVKIKKLMSRGLTPEEREAVRRSYARLTRGKI